MPVLEELTLMHYHLRRRLAQGGMSEVYLADDIANHRLVAIKLVSNERQEFYERFQREVETMAALSHDHILPAFDHGTYGFWYYMVMPYIEYGTLRDKLAQGPLSLKDAGMLLEQIADALQFAHDHALLHRDIKPSNILLRDGEHVYLADFGLVKHMRDESTITQTGCLIGTPEYMAPELSEEMATPQSDIYALGIVLYQMLTGQVPFKSQTPMGIYWKHLREQPVPPSQINPLITRRVEQVVLRALEKEPQRRYASARAFADAYHEAIESSAGHLAQLAHFSTLTLSLAQTAEVRRFLATMPLSNMWRTKTALRSLPRSSKVAVTAVVAMFVLCVLPTVLGFTLYQDLSHKDVPRVNLAANVLFKGNLPPFTPTPMPTPIPITPTPTATKKPTSQPKTHTVSYTTPTQNNADPDHDGPKKPDNNNDKNHDGNHDHKNHHGH